MTLEDLYNELGTMKWAGADDGWDLAINAVRKKIAESLKEDEKPTNAFGMTDEDIQKAYEELQEAIEKGLPGPGVITTTPFTPFTDMVEKVNKTSMWGICPVCGREEKYTSGLGMSITHCKYDCTNKKGTKGSNFYEPQIQPRTICLFDAIDDWSDTPIMGLACTCPKCSPR
jgi:hypothetical protein